MAFLAKKNFQTLFITLCHVRELLKMMPRYFTFRPNLNGKPFRSNDGGRERFLEKKRSSDLLRITLILFFFK